MTAYELAATITAFLALLISVLSFGYNSISSLKSLSASEQANKIANRALEIALREHKTKIVPNLIIEFSSFLVQYSETKNYSPILPLVLKNTTHFNAKIENIKVIGDFFMIADDLPIVLKLNNEYSFNLKMKSKSAILITNESLAQASFSAKTHEQRLNDYTLNLIHKLKFKVIFTDELSNKYTAYLTYIPSVGKFSGEISEIDA